MPVTIVVGGQFGSEGKGKVAHHLARQKGARAVVRVGGTNSGHTACDFRGSPQVLRQLPTAALLPDVTCILPAGSYVDPDVLLREMEQLQLAPERLLIDHNAMTITAADRALEQDGTLGPRIGSTCSGTGAAVVKRAERRSRNELALASPALQPFLGDAHAAMGQIVDDGHNIVVEGTQGYGLSLLHSRHYPKVTSRDTTAAGALAECGMSPLDVDEICLVLRAFPIRVSGNSGPFDSEEITWETIQDEGGHAAPLEEYTSVTRRLRRVARFDPVLVRRAVSVNGPTSIVLNHVDHVDAEAGRLGAMTPKTHEFVDWVAEGIGREINTVGLGPDTLLMARAVAVAA